MVGSFLSILCLYQRLRVLLILVHLLGTDLVQTWYLFPFQNFATSGANEYAMLGFMRYYTCAFAFTTFPIQSGMPSIFVVEPIHIVAFDEANNLFEKVDGHLLGTLLGTWYIAFRQ